MKLFAVALVVAIFGVAAAQPGPDGPVTIDCYNCDGHHHGLPGCLSDVHRCHHDEVCVINYNGSSSPTIRCQPKHECLDEVAHPVKNCSGGGVEVSVHHGPAHGPGHHDQGTTCQKCCTDTACVSDMANLVRLEALTSPQLMCPGHCDPSKPEDCVSHAKQCHDGEFCKISKDHHEMKGECKPDHDFTHCTEEKQREAGCKDPHGHDAPHCTLACCTTNDCINSGLGMTTPAPPTTVAASTVAPGDTLWQRLHGECRDELAGEGCANMVTSQDVCHTSLALDICPDTCGLCGANNTVCRDTVVNNGCADLKVTKDVCNDPMAVFICPVTCNKCTELINSVVTSLVDGSSNATSAPASLTPATASPSDFPTFDCRTLDAMTCSDIATVCTSSLVKVVCPQKCAACATPDPVPTGVVTISANGDKRRP